MKAITILKSLMKKTKISNAKMAKRLGASSQIIYERLTQKNITVDKLLEMLNVIDYQLVIQPSNSRIADGGCKVTLTDKEVVSKDILDNILNDETGDE